MQRARISVTGKVQGVWFRHNANIIANKLGLKGYVRNTPDSVEIVAEGDAGQITKLIEFCQQGPPSARVEDVKVDEEEPTGEFNSFEIKYD